MEGIPSIPNIDQHLAAFRDVIPRTWYALYQGCLAAGFNEHQSFNLVQTYILSTGPCVRPNSEQGPTSDTAE